MTEAELRAEIQALMPRDWQRAVGLFFTNGAGLQPDHWAELANELASVLLYSGQSPAIAYEISLQMCDRDPMIDAYWALRRQTAEALRAKLEEDLRSDDLPTSRP